jgi:hypothetical protein
MLNAEAQKNNLSDSVNKNEVFINVAPGLISVLGGQPSYLSHFSCGYRRYLTRHLVLRTAILVFPSWTHDPLNGIPMYDRTINDKNIFRSYQAGHGTKTQVNVGAEKVFQKNRWTHGFGADLFVNHQTVNQSETYFFTPDSAANSGPAGQPQPHGVDSLGFSQYGRLIGFGLQVFYSVRFDLGKRWRLSSTIGPSINISRELMHSDDRRSNKTGTYVTWDLLFPNVPIVSDISVCYRF